MVIAGNSADVPGSATKHVYFTVIAVENISRNIESLIERGWIKRYEPPLKPRLISVDSLNYIVIAGEWYDGEKPF